MATKLGGILAGAFTISAITGAAQKLIAFASTLSDLSQKTGITTTGLQKLDLAFEQSGVGLDTVARSATELGARLAGDKGAQAMVAKLGLSLKDLMMMAPEAQLLKVADAIGNIQSQGEKALAAKTLLGKGGLEMLQGLNGHLQETVDKFAALGIIIDGKTIAAADDFGDQMTVLEKVGMAFIANVLAPMLPGLVSLAQWLTTAATGTMALAKGFEDGLIKALMQVAVGWDRFLLSVAEGSQKIPLLGKYLGASAETVASLKDNVQFAEDRMRLFSMTTDTAGETAKKVAPHLLGLGDSVKKIGKKAQQSVYDLGGVEEAFTKIKNATLQFDRANIAANAATSEELTKQQEVHAAAIIAQLSRTTAAEIEAAQLRRGIEFSAADYAIAQAQREHASKSDIMRMERELSLARLNASIADSEAEFKASTQFIDQTTTFGIAEYTALADVHHLMVEKMKADWEASQAAMQKSSTGFFGGIESGFRNLVSGMTGDKGVAGFMNHLGKGIVDGFGQILSNGLASVIQMGVNLAIEGIKKIGSIIGGLFQSEETKKVNKPRDEFFAQFGGWDGLATQLTNTLIGQGVDDAGNVALGLMSALNSATTESNFHSAEDAILAVFAASGQNFKKMAMGGSGTVTQPTLFLAGEAGPEEYSFSGANRRFGGGDAGLAEEVRALRRELPRAIGVALADALALA